MVDRLVAGTMRSIDDADQKSDASRHVIDKMEVTRYVFWTETVKTVVVCTLCVLGHIANVAFSTTDSRDLVCSHHRPDECRHWGLTVTC